MFYFTRETIYKIYFLSHQQKTNKCLPTIHTKPHVPLYHVFVFPFHVFFSPSLVVCICSLSSPPRVLFVD